MVNELKTAKLNSSAVTYSAILQMILSYDKTSSKKGKHTQWKYSALLYMSIFESIRKESSKTLLSLFLM